jgi:hypothetical protein
MEDYYQVSVSGRIFYLDFDTVCNIPYISKEMIEKQKRSIFIPRSPMVFEEVLAYSISSKHPFPDKYLYELEFYGVNYESKLVFPKENPVLFLRELNVSDSQKLIELEQKINEITKGLILTQNIAYNLLSWSRPKLFCRVRGCGNTVTTYSHFCESCGIKNRGKCIFKGEDKNLCGAATPGNFNYCNEHNDKGGYCNVLGCILLRIQGEHFCYKHRT